MGAPPNGAAMLDRARERLVTAGLRAEIVEREGEPDVELAELAKAADAVLVGRRGVTTKGAALGPTVVSLIKIAERCVIVCGGLPSPMTSCALAFDGRETSQRPSSSPRARHRGREHDPSDPRRRRPRRRSAGGRRRGSAALEQRVPFVTTSSPAPPAKLVARVIKRTRCDACSPGPP